VQDHPRTAQPSSPGDGLRREAITPWLWLRSATYLAWLVLTVIPYGTVVVLASLFLKGESLYRLCLGWVRLAMWGSRTFCGIHAQIQGMEHLPSGPLILLVKHQSAWETLALPLLMPHPLCYVFKRELLYIPFFGWSLGRLDMVRIDRSRRAQAFDRMTQQGARLLTQGNWIILFPEGTRTARGSRGAYKLGGTRLAIATDTPVLPIAVTSGQCWPRQAFIKRPGTIQVSIGQPIAPSGRSAEDLMAEVEDWIEAEMRRLDPQAYPTGA
jgi:1-acyl-sn-glycerol-3-phosphate acyltransferase